MTGLDKCTFGRYERVLHEVVRYAIYVVTMTPQGRARREDVWLVVIF